MWKWFCLRSSLGATSPALFSLPNGEYLTEAMVISHIQDGLEKLGRGRPKITGKGFRRGGASTLIGNNVPRVEAAAAGGWKSLAMLDTYANAASKQKRALMVSRNMAP